MDEIRISTSIHLTGTDPKKIKANMKGPKDAADGRGYITLSFGHMSTIFLDLDHAEKIMDELQKQYIELAVAKQVLRRGRWDD